MTARPTFKFSTTLSNAKGNFISTVIYLPKKIVEMLPKGRIRAKGTMNGKPFALAPQYKKDGSRFFTVSSKLRQAAKIKIGDKVEVVFKLVDKDAIEMPEELDAVLSQDEKAKSAWDTLTSGKQRDVIIYVTAVKNIDSRISRALHSLEKVKTGLLTAKKSISR
ncbi:MAG TPA: YdeI/OmpD-associated family protein [Chryseolinea sp.]